MAIRIRITADATLLWTAALEMEQSSAPVNPPPVNKSQWEWDLSPVPTASQRSELKLLEASNLYKLATCARNVPTKIENISLALQCIEEGLAVAEPQSQIKYALIAKKAHIQMDILEDTRLEYLHVDYPLLSRKFPILRMSIDEIDQMVKTAHYEFITLRLQSAKLLNEFTNLSLRVEAARIPELVGDRIEAEPIELEEEAIEADLIDPPVDDVQRAVPDAAPPPAQPFGEMETVGPMALNHEGFALAGDPAMPVPRTQSMAKKILKQANDRYWKAFNLTDELEKKSQLQSVLDIIEVGLKDTELKTIEKAALILRKSQIQFDLGKNRSMIKRQIKVIQKEIDDPDLKWTQWNTIYSFNHLLDKIKEEQFLLRRSNGLKRKSGEEIIDSLRSAKKAKM